MDWETGLTHGFCMRVCLWAEEVGPKFAKSAKSARSRTGEWLAGPKHDVKFQKRFETVKWLLVRRSLAWESPKCSLQTRGGGRVRARGQEGKRRRRCSEVGTVEEGGLQDEPSSACMATKTTSRHLCTSLKMKALSPCSSCTKRSWLGFMSSR